MTISIWRYSHLALAVSSFLLLSLASVTGIILSFEPVTQKVQPYKAQNFSEATLAQTIPALKKLYPDISELSIDDNQFVKIKASDAEGENLEAFVDPLSGKILGKPGKKSEFFETITSLHRSLFLHETGRLVMGITAFLLSLIAISGIMLVIQRQRGLKRFFAKIARDGWAPYYHVVLGRLALIPILIIALSGTYLSLVRFKFIKESKITHEVDFDAIKTEPAKATSQIEIFKNTFLSDVESVEFPFSEDAEDYFTIKLHDRELTVNQLTGDILTEIPYSNATVLAKLSLNLHTGRTNVLWALLLAIASGHILFFIYSGFVITLNRRKNLGKNKYKANESRFIILVGSENGGTFKFAQLVHQQLLLRGEKSHLTELNNYKAFPKAEHIVIMTSTYGLGEAPSNGKRFASLLQKYPQVQTVKFSVVGFGSHAYADFCRFAHEVNNLLSQQLWARPLLEIHTVNDKSNEEFKLWAETWSAQANVTFEASAELPATAPTDLSEFTVLEKSAAAQKDDTFLIRLQVNDSIGFTSGDLLAIYPANDHRERLYSIGRVKNAVQLSIKLHENGLGSGFLNRLKEGDSLRARIVTNQHFHFPKQAPCVVMVSNGTGIAPFLGMISDNADKRPSYLYCGFRERSSFTVFEDFLEGCEKDGKLNRLELALSREGEKQYVSHLIERDAGFFAKTLAEKGVLMLCGSLSMQKDVISLLDTICQKENGQSVSYYQSHGQILMDCY